MLDLPTGMKTTEVRTKAMLEAGLAWKEVQKNPTEMTRLDSIADARNAAIDLPPSSGQRKGLMRRTVKTVGDLVCLIGNYTQI